MINIYIIYKYIYIYINDNNQMLELIFEEIFVYNFTCKEMC